MPVGDAPCIPPSNAATAPCRRLRGSAGARRRVHRVQPHAAALEVSECPWHGLLAPIWPHPTHPLPRAAAVRCPGHPLAGPASQHAPLSMALGSLPRAEPLPTLLSPSRMPPTFPLRGGHHLYSGAGVGIPREGWFPDGIHSCTLPAKQLKLLRCLPPLGGGGYCCAREPVRIPPRKRQVPGTGRHVDVVKGPKYWPIFITHL